MPAWAGLWDGIYMQPYSQIDKPNPGFRLRRAMKGVTANKYKTVLKVLVDGAVGDPALKTHPRIVAGTPFAGSTLGGKRVIETVTDVNRVTVAADITQIDSDILFVHTPTPFPTEKSGNSGGGKLGF